MDKNKLETIKNIYVDRYLNNISVLKFFKKLFKKK